MKVRTGFVSIGLFTATAMTAVPTQMAHQGVVAVNGNRFTGNGTFYFALVGNGGAGNNLWTNDGSELGTTNRPTAGVSISVADGVYSANLGGGTMTPIQPSVFNNANVVLRIWFDDGNNGVQQLVPDQAISLVPYAARSAFEPPIGSVIAWHKNPNPGDPGAVLLLPDGWLECNGQALPLDSPIRQTGAVNLPNLNNSPSGYDGGRFLRGGNTSGIEQDSSFHYAEGAGGWIFDSTSGVLPVGGQNVEKAINLNVPGLNAILQSIQVINREYRATRPVNMSVVWIMRVK